MERLSNEWEPRISQSTGKTYYFNNLTNQTQWNHPNEQKVRVSHIIIKHAESRKPFSWRSPRIKKSKEDAFKLVTYLRKKALSGQADFQDLARDYSDCNSAKEGGNLGYIYVNQLQKEFEDVAFKLEIGEISHPVWTISGVHIIQRTA